MTKISFLYIYPYLSIDLSFTGALELKKLLANAGDIETQVQPLGWEDPLEEGTATHSSVLSTHSLTHSLNLSIYLI